MSLSIYHKIKETAILEAKSVEFLLPHFVCVTDIDDSPDLTDVHPRDRNDMNLNFISLDNDLFSKTRALVNGLPEIRDAYIIALGPQSQLHLHVDTIDLEPYADVDWLSVYMGMFVPSYDASKVAVKVGDTIYDHKETIVFDTQIPHSAWNWTDDWWVSIRLAVYKSMFE
jgi:hypothetical protein